MENIYWQKQTDQPLFEDLIWSRPENKAQAGKLLIIGGNLHGFSAPAEAYAQGTKAGIGTARVLLPNALQKTVGRILENGEYAPSTPSGSFAKNALAELLDHGAWADGVLLAGDFGRNSETAILLEEFVTKFSGQLTFTKDSIDHFLHNPGALLSRPKTTLVVTMAELQKLFQNVGAKTAIKSNMDLVPLVEALHEFSSAYQANIITKQNEYIIVAQQGKVSSSKITQNNASWQVKTASYATVWWLQNPTKSFEALTTAVYESIK